MNNLRKIKYASCSPVSAFNDIYLDNPNSLLFENRIFNRPLSGGMSIGNFLNMYGTLGGLFRDETDGTIVGLTCRHVCDKMMRIGVSFGDELNPVSLPPRTYPFGFDYIRTRFTSLSDRFNPAFIINSETVVYKEQYPNNFYREYADYFYNKVYRGITYSIQTFNRNDISLNTNLLNAPIYQPGYPLFNTITYINFMSGFSLPDNNISAKVYPYTIGHVKRVVPLVTDERNFNEIDSAVIAIEQSPNEDLILNESSCNYIGFSKRGGSLFASTAEINSLSNNPNTPLFKTGAGTGPIGENTICYSLSFNGFYNFISVEGVNYRNGISFIFYNTNNINSKITSLSTLEGDSGSMLWALLSSNNPAASAWKIIGQVFAYSDDNLPVIGYASRIDKIKQALNILPWDGKNIVFTPASPKYFTAFSFDETITKMGRKCFRVSNFSTTSASYPTGDFTISPVVSTTKPSFYLNYLDYLYYNDQLLTFGNF